MKHYVERFNSHTILAKLKFVCRYNGRKFQMTTHDLTEFRKEKVITYLSKSEKTVADSRWRKVVATKM